MQNKLNAMQNKFQNKYRISSTRLQSWDYGNDGSYFITICTKDRKHYFGEVVEGEMKLNEVGKLAEKYWLEIPEHFNYIELGNFIVMPNHVHGILIVNKTSVETRFIASNIELNSELNSELNNSETRIIASKSEMRLMASNGETRLIASVPKNSGGFSGEKNPMLNESISKIIRWYKGRCSFEIRKINSDFSWHSRFYDIIIRNSKSFENIQNYIEANPKKWFADKFYK